MKDIVRRPLRHPFAVSELGGVGLSITLSTLRGYHQTLLAGQQSPPVPTAARFAPQAINQARIANLFWAPVAPSNEPPRNKLLGSFVNANISAAFSQVDGKPAYRMAVGQEVVSSVSLTAVSADHLIPKRNGIAERLSSARRLEPVKAHDHAGHCLRGFTGKFCHAGHSRFLPAANATYVSHA